MVTLSELVDQHAPCSARRFYAARGLAVDAYTHIESHLREIFRVAFGASTSQTVSPQKAALADLVFSKASNAQSRNEVIEACLRFHLPPGHRHVIGPLMKSIKIADDSRNKIAHWTASRELGSDGRLRLHLHKMAHFNANNSMFFEEIFVAWKHFRYLSIWLTAIVQAMQGRTHLGDTAPALNDVLSARFEFPPSEDHPLHFHWTPLDGLADLPD